MDAAKRFMPSVAVAVGARGDEGAPEFGVVLARNLWGLRQIVNIGILEATMTMKPF